MNDSFQKESENIVKRDSIGYEIRYLLSTVDTNISRNVGNLDPRANVDSIKSLMLTSKTILQQCNKLVVYEDVYQRKCELFKIPFHFANTLLFIGLALTCLSFIFIVLEELQEAKNKLVKEQQERQQTKRYY